MLIPGKKRVSIPVAIVVSMGPHAIAVMVTVTLPVVIPPLDFVIPVFTLVLVGTTALRQRWTGG